MEERIIEYVDIDTRRALGLPPRRLQIDRDQVFMNRVTKKYYPDRHLIIEFHHSIWNHNFEMFFWNNVRYDPVSGRFIGMTPDIPVVFRKVSCSTSGISLFHADDMVWVKDVDT